MIYLYRVLAFPIVALGFLISYPLSRKVREGFTLRAKVKPKPLSNDPVWFHCSSGEYEYARSVIREIKQSSPDTSIMVTYFSPTYSRVIAKDPLVDISLPLPLDLPTPCRHFLKKYHPKKLLIARTDLWPELLTQCQIMGISTTVFSVTEREKKSFFSRWFKKWIYSLVDKIYCVHEKDKAVLLSLSERLESKVTVLGDTRYDQVFHRLESRSLPEISPEEKRKTLVAGSVWSEDNQFILPELAPLVLAGQLNLIVVPHEPTESELRKIASQLSSLGVESYYYSEDSQIRENQVMIVDRVGVLAELYSRGQMAFVGGSFRSSVHSVMEPLCTGAVTIVGPYYKNNREAQIYSEEKLFSNFYFVNVVTQRGELSHLIQGLLSSKGYDDLLKEKMQANRGASQRLVEQLGFVH